MTTIAFGGRGNSGEKSQKSVRRMAAALKHRYGAHHIEEAEALSDRVAILKSGRLLLTGTPAGIKAQAGTDKFDEAFVRFDRHPEEYPGGAV